MNTSKFETLGLSGKLLAALADAGYTRPTPIQEQAIPVLLGKTDMVAVAQTGTGKTAAFTLPLLHNLEADGLTTKPKRPRAVILTPTRELATQILDNIRAYSRHMKIRLALVMGGVRHKPQIETLRRGPDILVATPGRLLDLVSQGRADLRDVDYAILDEADRMLDMGFVRDVREIFSYMPAKRQTMMFSATMPPEIEKLATEILSRPEKVRIEAKAIDVNRIDQSVEFLSKAAKLQRLVDLVAEPDFDRVIVFVRMKYAAERIAGKLAAGGVAAEALHGNKAQSARQRSLDSFRKGKVRVLVATDIASRGIDVDNVTHVINYDLPEEAEVYVHRIGRTARAGKFGAAISFCDAGEVKLLRAIEKLIGRNLDAIGELPAPVKTDARRPGNKKSFRRKGSRGNHNKHYVKPGSVRRQRSARQASAS